MLFFSIKTKLFDTKDLKGKEAQRVFALSVQSKTEIFYQKHNKKVFMSVEYIQKTQIMFIAVLENTYITGKSEDFLESLLKEYVELLALSCDSFDVSEITFNALCSMIRNGHFNSYFDDYFEILNLLGLRQLREVEFLENIITTFPTKEELLINAKKILCETLLGNEIERIYQGLVKPVKLGHPVHYLIQTDDVLVRGQIVETLLTALIYNNRIQSTRYSTLVCHTQSRWTNYEEFYRSCKGGAVVIDYMAGQESFENYAKPTTDIIDRLCSSIKGHKNDVLTILCFNRNEEKVKSSFMERLGVMPIVSLSEDTIFGEKAKDTLRQMAQNVGIAPDSRLYECIYDPNKGYHAADLHNEFDRWFAHQLKTRIYPQYADIKDSEKFVVEGIPKGSAYEELKSMIGLLEAKAIVDQALDYYKAQKLFSTKGMPKDNGSMHMVFTGNPGTAKTSVARLFAQIMKDNDLLSIGDLVEVGRSDLVGQYVGWTATMVKRKFLMAKGSVLFIDEAYSLLDGKPGSFGEEAINTIVQEMENNREDMIVIFAGYPDIMEDFIRSNPGLKSRIAFHVPFNDYNAEELYSILELMVNKKKMMLGADIKDRVLPILQIESKKENFGNGRYVRNLLEKAKLKQASRLVAMDIDTITQEDIKTLVAMDFEIPNEPIKRKSEMGF